MEIRHENLECTMTGHSTTCLDCYRSLGNRAVDDLRQARREKLHPIKLDDLRWKHNNPDDIEYTTVADRQSYADWERTKEPPDDKDFDWDAYMTAEEDHPWE